MKRGKKYIEAAKQVERGNLYVQRRSSCISKKDSNSKV